MPPVRPYAPPHVIQARSCSPQTARERHVSIRSFSPASSHGCIPLARLGRRAAERERNAVIQLDVDEAVPRGFPVLE